VFFRSFGYQRSPNTLDKGLFGTIGDLRQPFRLDNFIYQLVRRRLIVTVIDIGHDKDVYR
jgi:hypothetical protein